MNVLNPSRRIINLFILLISLLFLNACSSDDPIPPMPPQITEISNAENELVEQGVIGETYNIHGMNFKNITSITFNGYNFNLSDVIINDELLQVTISENIPYLDQNNELAVTTNGGTATIDFSLLTIESISSETVEGYDVVYVMGGDFTNFTEVIIDPSATDENDEINALILEFNSSTITISKPLGIAQGTIIVKTSQGATISFGPYFFG